ncbi:hypothetical protein ACA910_004597 [Epithemia clementina (nom. ined.)]
MSLQVYSDFQESTEKILIWLERLQVELENSNEADLASEDKAPTIWGSLWALSSAIQSIKEVSDDWKKDGSTQRKELNKILKVQIDLQANLKSFKEGVKGKLEKLKVSLVAAIKGLISQVSGLESSGMDSCLAKLEATSVAKKHIRFDSTTEDMEEERSSMI